MIIFFTHQASSIKRKNFSTCFICKSQFIKIIEKKKKYLKQDVATQFFKGVNRWCLWMLETVYYSMFTFQET